MLWGHKIRTKDGLIEVTRESYNQAFNWPVPERPEVPEYLMHVWVSWQRLNARRPPSDSMCPLQYSEIESFARLSGEPVSPEDLRMIEATDNAYLRAIAEEQKAAAERREEERKNQPKPKR